MILINQFRPGPEKSFLILPGGMIDDKEEAIDSIKRELLEETGYSGEFEYVSVYYQYTYMTEKVYCYIAKNCIKLKEPKTATEISKEIGKHRSSISRILLSLEKKGLVKCVNPEDDRYRHYQITNKGKESI